ANRDADRENRRTAVHQLGEFEGDRVVDELMKIYASDADMEVKRAVLHALAETKSPRAQVRLLEVARTDVSPELRRDAINVLGERASARSLDFLSATAQSADGNTEVQMQAVRAISERSADEAVPILIKIAKTHPNQLVRRQAIRALGESGDPRAVEFFREVLAK